MGVKKWLFFAYLVGLVTIPIVFFFLPKDFFNHGQSMCLSVLFFDVTCYGCGMLRALKHISCLDFAMAWELNRLSFVVFPLLSYLWIKEIIRVKTMWRKLHYTHKK